MEGEFPIKEKPIVMIIGTSHLANPDNGDMFMPQTESMLTEERQRQITEVTDALSRFKPTKVAVEVLSESETELNSDYRDYLKGVFHLSASEHHQLGFRLAKESGLNKVDAVDWNQKVDGVPDLGQWVSENGSKLFEEVIESGRKMTEEMEAYLKNHSLKDYLLWLNQPKAIRQNQEIYMKIALVGDDENPVGAMWTGQYWYYRNLRIYQNIVKLSVLPNERILVLYGAGHLHLLHNFLKESGMFEVVDAHAYLAK